MTVWFKARALVVWKIQSKLSYRQPLNNNHLSEATITLEFSLNLYGINLPLNNDHLSLWWLYTGLTSLLTSTVVNMLILPRFSIINENYSFTGPNPTNEQREYISGINPTNLCFLRFPIVPHFFEVSKGIADKSISNKVYFRPKFKISKMSD